MVQKALLRTRIKLTSGTRKKLNDLWQWEELQDLVESEPRRTIERWKGTAEGEGRK